MFDFSILIVIYSSDLEGAIFVNEGANGINEYEAGI